MQSRHGINQSGDESNKEDFVEVASGSDGESAWEIISSLSSLIRPRFLGPPIPAVAKPASPSRRKLHWTPIANDSNTIFSSIDQSSAPLAGSSVATLLSGQGASSKLGKRGSDAVVSDKIEILDNRTAQNVSIVLRRILSSSGLSAADLALKINTVSLSIPLDVADQLLACISAISASEVKAITECSEILLRPEPERILHPILITPGYLDKLRLIVCQHSADTVFNEAKARLATLETAATDARNSNQLKIILSVAIRLGNTLNGTSVRAISLESLLKLKDYRVSGTSALHALGEQLKQTPDFSLDIFNAELASAVTACKSPAAESAREAIAWLDQHRVIAPKDLALRLAGMKSELQAKLGLSAVTDTIKYLGSEAASPQEFFDTLVKIRKDIQSVA